MEQGLAAERLAADCGFTRRQLDEFGLMSQERAATARDRGWFDAEIVPVREKVHSAEPGAAAPSDRDVLSDEGIRPTSIDALQRRSQRSCQTGS